MSLKAIVFCALAASASGRVLLQCVPGPWRGLVASKQQLAGDAPRDPPARGSGGLHYLAAAARGVPGAPTRPSAAARSTSAHGIVRGARGRGSVEAWRAGRAFWGAWVLGAAPPVGVPPPPSAILALPPTSAPWVSSVPCGRGWAPRPAPWLASARPPERAPSASPPPSAPPPFRRFSPACPTCRGPKTQSDINQIALLNQVDDAKPYPYHSWTDTAGNGVQTASEAQGAVQSEEASLSPEQKEQLAQLTKAKQHQDEQKKQQ